MQILYKTTIKLPNSINDRTPITNKVFDLLEDKRKINILLCLPLVFTIFK